MSDYAIMSLILSVLLIVSGVLRMMRRTLCRTQGDAALPMAAMLAGGSLLALLLSIVITRFAGLEMLLPGLLLLVGALTCAAALEGLSSIRGRGAVLAAVLLALWLLAVAAGTVLMRRSGDVCVLLRFDSLPDMVRQHSVRPLTDPLLNLLLFLPLGLLLPHADAARAPWMNVLATALLITCAIEGLQLMLCLGQADVEDLATNVLGALCGLALARLLPARRAND